MNAKVLVVEDDADVGELVRDALRKRGYDADFVSSATAALERLRDDEYDLVLTDVHMEGLSGIELCERTRASRPDVPVVLLTGQSSLDTAIAAIRAGAYDFVTKPIQLEPLAAVV